MDVNLLFIPEITTTWNVNVKNPELEEAIELIKSDKILSIAGDDVLERLESTKAELEGLADPVAMSIGETQKSYQEQYIRANGNISQGMMLNGTEITPDGVGTVHVGNTASSVEGFPYPLAIETGRREVYPINGKWLRWFEGGNIMGGKPIFAKRSKAVKAHPFVEPSKTDTLSDIEKIVYDTLDGVLG